MNIRHIARAAAEAAVDERKRKEAERQGVLRDAAAAFLFKEINGLFGPSLLSKSQVSAELRVGNDRASGLPRDSWAFTFFGEMFMARSSDDGLGFILGFYDGQAFRRFEDLEGLNTAFEESVIALHGGPEFGK